MFQEETPNPENDPAAPMLAVLKDVLRLIERKRAQSLVVLAVTDEGVEIFNTVGDLGELALVRDELSDMIDEARRGG